MLGFFIVLLLVFLVLLVMLGLAALVIGYMDNSDLYGHWEDVDHD